LAAPITDRPRCGGKRGELRRFQGRADEEKPVIADTQPQLFSSLEGFYIADARFREAVQCEENLHRDRLA
jgi:hypothetical protein